jgi:hypothetical protein
MRPSPPGRGRKLASGSSRPWISKAHPPRALALFVQLEAGRQRRADLPWDVHLDAHLAGLRPW